MEIGPGDRIVELQCGAGEFSVLLAAHVSEGLVAAFDPSEDNIRAARARARDLDNVLFITDVEPRLPWKEDFFSKAFSHGWPVNLAEIYRVLAPGGILFIGAPQTRDDELHAAGFTGIERREPLLKAAKP